jgi:hypothetical protein
MVRKAASVLSRVRKSRLPIRSTAYKCLPLRALPELCLSVPRCSFGQESQLSSFVKQCNISCLFAKIANLLEDFSIFPFSYEHDLFANCTLYCPNTFPTTFPTKHNHDEFASRF